ncbi:MAG: ABC transporter permease [Christensenella sp.]|nr:ABC transporter permease [Christensenella sp.]
MSGKETVQRNGFQKFVHRPEFATLIIFIAMIAIVAILQGNFFDPSSLRNSVISWTPLILLSLGQAIVIIAGGLDLSAGPAMAFMMCVMASIMKKDDPASGGTALLVGIVVMLVVGLVNGLSVGYLKLPPLIATFATSYIWLGASLFIMPTPGGECANWMRIFYSFDSVTGMPEALKAFGSAIPTGVLLIIAAVIIWYCVSRTKTGRYIYAVGSDRTTAFQSGINTAKVQTMAYMLNSLFIFFCALFMVAQNQAGSARIGDPLTLQCVAAAVVGGIALTGGRGNVFMAIVGAIIMSLVSKLIYVANIESAYQSLVSGIIIIAAIASSTIYTTINEKALLKGGRAK